MCLLASVSMLTVTTFNFMSTVRDKIISPQEYLELERKASYKSEYHDGLIVPMAGASPQHIDISSNMLIELGVCLKGKTCKVCNSELKVRTRTKYSYPDLTVVCGEPLYEYDADRNGILMNPTLIVEVLSTSTEAYDRGEKFAAYRELQSFREYLLVSQTQPLIDQFVKQADGSWRLIPVQGLEASVRLETISCTLVLRDIYNGVSFDSVNQNI
jgi:Uma2 family endonuclease